jgi:hypothetical protein
MKRLSFLGYGLTCYAASLVTTVYAIGFVGNFWQFLGLKGAAYRSLDFGGKSAPLAEALAIDALLVALFGLQHSVMARASFKRVWTRVVPSAIERSSYVLAASACLGLLFWQWRPIRSPVVWDVSDGPLGRRRRSKRVRRAKGRGKQFRRRLLRRFRTGLGSRSRVDEAALCCYSHIRIDEAGRGSGGLEVLRFRGRRADGARSGRRLRG